MRRIRCTGTSTAQPAVVAARIRGERARRLGVLAAPLRHERPDHRHQAFQLALADAELREVVHRVDDVVEIDARRAARAADEARLDGERQRAGVARVRALDEIGDRHHLRPLRLHQRDRQVRLAIDARSPAALAQIPERRVGHVGRDAEGDASHEPPRSSPSTMPGRDGVPR